MKFSIQYTIKICVDILYRPFRETNFSQWSASVEQIDISNDNFPLNQYGNLFKCSPIYSTLNCIFLDIWSEENYFFSCAIYLNRFCTHLSLGLQLLEYHGVRFGWTTDFNFAIFVINKRENVCLKRIICIDVTQVRDEFVKFLYICILWIDFHEKIVNFGNKFNTKVEYLNCLNLSVFGIVNR